MPILSLPPPPPPPPFPQWLKVVLVPILSLPPLSPHLHLHPLSPQNNNPSDVANNLKSKDGRMVVTVTNSRFCRHDLLNKLTETVKLAQVRDIEGILLGQGEPSIDYSKTSLIQPYC